ncbi:hypothetical protein AHAS_Ahas09G0225100 [Arachis hypogaea]
MHSHRSGDAVLGDIDLLTVILLLLSVKDLLRSKCVCKKWKSLISEDQFCYQHTLGLCRKYKHIPNPYPSGILRQTLDSCLFNKRAKISPFTNNSNSRFTYLHADNKLDKARHYKIEQSCNGLLLWRSTPGDLTSLTYDAGTKVITQGGSFYVSNPSTGHYVRIDKFGYEFHPKFSNPFLVFEPWKSPHYKIIFFTKLDGDRNKPTTKMEMSVYSSETGSWSKVDFLTSFPNDIYYFDNGVYCNGAVHWFAIGKSSVYLDVDLLCVKNLPTLPLPLSVPLSDLLEDVYFGECGGNIHLIVAKYNEKLRYDIWELKEDYSGWIVRYYIDLTSLQSDRGHFDVSCVVRQPPKEDEDEEAMLAIVSDEMRKFVAYNLKDHSSRIIYEIKERRYLLYLHHQYFETLAVI